jgi:methylaspartate ammonia-lyase
LVTGIALPTGITALPANKSNKSVSHRYCITWLTGQQTIALPALTSINKSHRIKSQQEQQSHHIPLLTATAPTRATGITALKSQHITVLPHTVVTVITSITGAKSYRATELLTRATSIRVTTRATVYQS